MTEIDEKLLKAHEVADIFRVNIRTVARWTATGKIPHIRTPGGQYRYYETHIYPLLNP